jgi:hypothetical protein
LQSFPNWQHSMICKHGRGIKQRYLVAFLGCCDFLQEVANNAPMTFMFQRPDYPSVHWLYDWRAGYFLFNHTLGFPVHGSVANPCMFPESITPSIRRCQLNCLVLRLILQPSVSKLDPELAHLTPVSAWPSNCTLLKYFFLFAIILFSANTGTLSYSATTVCSTFGWVSTFSSSETANILHFMFLFCWHIQVTRKLVYFLAMSRN